MSSLSSPAFLRRGSTCAVLNAVGKHRSANERFAMCSRIGAKTLTDDRRSDAGSTSRGDGLICDDVSTLHTSSAVTGVSSVSSGLSCGGLLKANSFLTTMDSSYFIHEKPTEAGCQFLAILITVWCLLTVVQHIVHDSPSGRRVTCRISELLFDAVRSRACDGLTSCCTCCIQGQAVSR